MDSASCDACIICAHFCAIHGVMWSLPRPSAQPSEWTLAPAAPKIEPRPRPGGGNVSHNEIILPRRLIHSISQIQRARSGYYVRPHNGAATVWPPQKRQLWGRPASTGQVTRVERELNQIRPGQVSQRAFARHPKELECFCLSKSKCL